MKTNLLKLLSVAAIGATMALPAMSMADWRGHRNDMQNQWKNIGIGAAAVGIYGLLTHNSTLGLLGAAGAGYSAYRYDQDRKSTSGWDHRYDYRNSDRNRYDRDYNYSYGRSHDRRSHRD